MEALVLGVPAKILITPFAGGTSPADLSTGRFLCQKTYIPVVVLAWYTYMVRLSVVLAGEREFYKNISRTSAVSSTNFGSIDYSSLQAAL